MWDIIMWLVVGGLAGWIASMIMKKDAQMGALANIVVGIVGALLGGWLARVVFDVNVDPNGFSLVSLIVAIVGATILLGLIGLVKR